MNDTCVCADGYQGTNVQVINGTATGCTLAQPAKVPTDLDFYIRDSGLDEGEISAIAVPIVLLGGLFLFGFFAGIYVRSRKAVNVGAPQGTELMPVP